MSSLSLPENGHEISLTGDQAKFIRTVLGLSQQKLAKRIGVSQPVIGRIEKKQDQACKGPEIILIRLLAEQYAIQVPAQPFKRDVELSADGESQPTN